MKSYRIYKVTCSVNNKSYIGYTEREAEARFDSHLSTARNNGGFRFHHAIRFHGESAFSVETLIDNIESMEEAKQLEIQMIKEHQSFGDGGYNANEGGTGGFVVRDIEAWKEKLSNASAGANNPRHSGLTDDDLLNMVKSVVDRHNNYSGKLVREDFPKYPKSLSQCRFSQYEGTGTQRMKQAYFAKFGLEVKYTFSEEHRQKLAKHGKSAALNNFHRK